MRVFLVLTAAASCVGLGLRAPAATGDAAELAPPVAVKVGGVPIDLAAHADRDRDDNSFPWVGDFDGDGKLDLLVGQHARGKGRGGQGGHLRIYRNLGTNKEPRLAEPVWFHDKVPTGVIPFG
jgi:FG-GAP repeat